MSIEVPKNLKWLDDLTWPEAMAGGAMIGGGGYGAIMLLKELYDKTLAANKAVPTDEKEITVDVPASKEIPFKVGEVKQADFNLGLLASTAMGVPIGVAGMKFLYDKLKHKQLEKEIDDAKQEYLQVLTQVANKNASFETPLTDAICEGFAATIEKNADWFTDAWNTVGDWGKTTKDSLTKAWSPAANDSQRAFAQNRLNEYFFDDNKKWRVALALGIPFAATAALGGGWMLRAYEKKKEDEAKRITPSRVTLNYV